VDILIVEDDIEQSSIYRAALGAGGYTLRTCNDGASALAAIAERLPDLALLDVNTPGPDGYDVCRAIRQREAADQPVTIIMVTARNDTASKLLAFAAGADDYLIKPVDLAELRSRIARWLGTRAAQVDVARHRRQETIREVITAVGSDTARPVNHAMAAVERLLDRPGLDPEVSQQLRDIRQHLQGLGLVLDGLRRPR